MSFFRFGLVWALAVLALAPSAGAKRLRLKKPHPGVQVRMAPFTIPEAHERETCQYLRLPNKKAMDVQELRFRLSPGTHHFALWGYLGTDGNDDHFPKGFVDSPGCIGFGPSDSINKATLGGAPHGGDYRLRFPPGVALRIAPRQQVFLNAHYINGSLTDPMQPQIVFNVIPAKPGTVQHHAESITIGNYGITVPAHGTATLVSEWRAPIDLNVFQLTSHQHKRGTHVTIEPLGGGTPIFENTNWEAPAELWLSTPIRVPAGGGFRFTCEWRNDDDKVVHFGVTTDDEMCFMTGYYYRDDESQPLPAVPGCFAQDAGLLCQATTVH
jgi:hypothetical protein